MLTKIIAAHSASTPIIIPTTINMVTPSLKMKPKVRSMPAMSERLFHHPPEATANKSNGIYVQHYAPPGMAYRPRHLTCFPNQANAPTRDRPNDNKPIQSLCRLPSPRRSLVICEYRGIGGVRLSPSVGCRRQPVLTPRQGCAAARGESVTRWRAAT